MNEFDPSAGQDLRGIPCLFAQEHPHKIDPIHSDFDVILEQKFPTHSIPIKHRDSQQTKNVKDKNHYEG